MKNVIVIVGTVILAIAIVGLLNGTVQQAIADLLARAVTGIGNIMHP